MSITVGQDSILLKTRFQISCGSPCHPGTSCGCALQSKILWLECTVPHKFIGFGMQVQYATATVLSKSWQRHSLLCQEARLAFDHLLQSLQNLCVANGNQYPERLIELVHLCRLDGLASLSMRLLGWQARLISVELEQQLSLWPSSETSAPIFNFRRFNHDSCFCSSGFPGRKEE